MDEEKIYSKEAASILGITYGHLRNQISNGRLKPVKLRGKNPYFTRSYLEKVLAEGYEDDPESANSED